MKCSVTRIILQYSFGIDFQVQNAGDTSNFDDYPDDEDEPPDDLTGWDKDF